MSPKKSSSNKSTSSRSTTSKKAPASSAASKPSRSSDKGTPAKKKPAAATKPDEMTGDVLEFIQAIDDYKRKENRPFPSWSEILEIVKTLGYERSKS